MKLFEQLISLLMFEDDIEVNNQHDDVDTHEMNYIPDIGSLSNQLKSCLQESDDLPLDFTKLFNNELFKFDTNLVPDAVDLYKKLNLKHEPLQLIAPQFESPMPPLKPAVFPPSIMDLPNPKLELFDLDEYFATEGDRIAQITNKCNDNDVD